MTVEHQRRLEIVSQLPERGIEYLFLGRTWAADVIIEQKLGAKDWPQHQIVGAILRGTDVCNRRAMGVNFSFRLIRHCRDHIIKHWVSGLPQKEI